MVIKEPEELGVKLSFFRVNGYMSTQWILSEFMAVWDYEN